MGPGGRLVVLSLGRVWRCLLSPQHTTRAWSLFVDVKAHVSSANANQPNIVQLLSFKTERMIQTRLTRLLAVHVAAAIEPELLKVVETPAADVAVGIEEAAKGVTNGDLSSVFNGARVGTRHALCARLQANGDKRALCRIASVSEETLTPTPHRAVMSERTSRLIAHINVLNIGQ